MIRQRLRMIPRRRRDHAALLFIRLELYEFVARPALFETPGALEVIELAINLRARVSRERQ